MAADVCLEELAHKTELYSGADIQNLCKEVEPTFLSTQSAPGPAAITEKCFCFSGRPVGSAGGEHGGFSH